MPTLKEPTHGWAEKKLERTSTAPLLPDPEPRERTYTIISVDDHLVEPRDLFEGRMPANLADAAPKVITNEHNQEMWLYEDDTRTYLGSGDFPRVRIGISDPAVSKAEHVDYLLSPIPDEQWSVLESAFEAAAKAVLDAVHFGWMKAMNAHNRRSGPSEDSEGVRE